MKRVIFVVLLFTAANAGAQASRTWIDGVGDDNNPCSRTAPCKTLSGTISKTATGGEINFMGHVGAGTVVITKSITIDGGGTKAAVGFPLSTGAVINGDGIHVVLRNLDFDGLGNGGLRGISILTAASVTIENCTINSFDNEGIRDVRTSGKLYVRNTTINGGIYGVLLSLSGVEAVLENVTIRDAVIGGARASQGTGRLHIVDSVFAGCGSGVLTDNGGEALVERSSFTYNATGVNASLSGTIRLSECVITKNGTGVLVTGTVESFGNNRITANTAGNGAGMTPLLEQ